MNSAKYIGLDVHQSTISAAVVDSSGKLVMECVLETKAATILQFFAGLRGTLHVTFEEGTCAAWLYDLLKPHVADLLVCNPRKNALLNAGTKSDRIDAHNCEESRLARCGALLWARSRRAHSLRRREPATHPNAACATPAAARRARSESFAVVVLAERCARGFTPPASGRAMPLLYGTDGSQK